MSIKVSSVTKLYGKQKALDNVSFEISAGEVVGLLGPNGAGKSTMMKIITCFIPPSEGEVWVSGFDIFEQALDVRKRVGYLPEHNPLYTDMYVKEYLTFIAGIHKLPRNIIKKRIDEMIEVTGLGVEQNKIIGTLSKGYRQRVGLAQALIHEPEVLILDEPTSGLDPNQIVDIRNLIKEIGKEKTVMLSTHIMQEIEAICDRVIIINKGTIVADNATTELQKLVQKADVITVEFDKEVDIKQLEAIAGAQKVTAKGAATYVIHAAQGNNNIRADVFQFAVKNNLTVLSLHKAEQRLEEVFRLLTK